MKRKTGLLKKAMELSILCQCEMAVVIFNHNGKLYDYGSTNIHKTIRRFKNKGKPDYESEEDEPESTTLQVGVDSDSGSDSDEPQTTTRPTPDPLPRASEATRSTGNTSKLGLSLTADSFKGRVATAGSGLSRSNMDRHKSEEEIFNKIRAMQESAAMLS